PPRERDGRLTRYSADEESSHWLQWGRRVNATEGKDRNNEQTPLHTVLQWGRRVNATEGRRDGLRCGVPGGLEWGRRGNATEGCATETRPSRSSTRFNGAAA